MGTVENAIVNSRQSKCTKLAESSIKPILEYVQKKNNHKPNSEQPPKC
ncbi:MAG: hypothetical protein RIS47_2071 [Bacteroidota bacterium]|jgi:hypothetical protein